ncbi:phosphatase PAP2 family protein [Patescibacteria group bacterium]|nr:phosphatase PAP2 family protein [Patescibacteria group bacterium]
MAIIQTIDQEIVKVATQLGGQDELRDQIVYVAAEILPFIVIAIGVWIFFRGGKTKLQKERNQNVILIALAAVLIALGVRWLIGETFDRERPFVTLTDLHHLNLVSASSNSFPSLHALLLFSFVGVIYFVGHHPNWSRLLLVICAIVIVARVVAGVHYPTDVLAGAILGLLVAKMLSFQSKWLEDQMK